jgi:hypothetical protein
LVLILLYKHLPGLQAQSLVTANGQKLRRLASSFVSLTNTALVGRTIIEVKTNTHRVFGTTFAAKYVDFILRHDQATSFFTNLNDSLKPASAQKISDGRRSYYSPASYSR